MKFVLASLALAAFVSAQEPETYTNCHLTCASANATSVCSNSNWNDTSCLCNGDFQQAVKVCLYRSDGCNTDVPSWFEKVGRECESAGVPVSSATGNYKNPNATGSRPQSGSAPDAAATSAAAAASGSTSGSTSAATRIVVGSAGVLAAFAGIAVVL